MNSIKTAVVQGARLAAAVMVSACVLAEAPATAPSTGPAAQATTRPTLDVPHAVQAPRLDAQADDPAWAHAAVIDGLSICMRSPVPNQTPSPTKILLMWDAKNLYIRFICTDEHLYSPHGEQRGAAHSQGDVAEVFLDAVGDGRAFLELQISPAGGVTTIMHLLTAPAASGVDGMLNETLIRKDMWEIPDWEIKGLRTATAVISDGSPRGWIADIALPAEPMLRRLGLRQYQPMTLRANLLRYDVDPPETPAAHKPVLMNWSPSVFGRPHRSPQAMGTLNLTASASGQ